MTNHYETPEVVEIGTAKSVIMGQKWGIQWDAETQEPNFDYWWEEIDE